MSIVNTKSTAITNADETQPRAYTQSWIERGDAKIAVGKVEVAAADDDTSVYRLVRISSGARVHKIELLSDAIAGGTDYNLGLYKPAYTGQGAVVDDNLFGDALDFSSGNTVPVEVTFDQTDIADIEKRVWELLGLAADPHTEYDICLTAVTAGTGAGTIAMRVEFVL
ncbi:MAG: hypothetical protein Q8R92_16735 [Deltaproteobacteria bacterium]|nr:hypothetical protein [Deltaproteobacteria bacterium]